MGSVHDKLAAGRLISARKAPYFRAMIQALVPTPMPGLGTIGVTKDALLVYDPEWVDQRSQDEMGALYWHEVMHLVLDHHSRRGDKDPFLWNVAGDVFINDQGRNMGLIFPKGGLFPETFGFPKNLTSDEYYALLLKEVEKQIKDAIDKAQSGQGAWKSGACGSGAGNPMDGEPQSGKGKGKDKGDKAGKGNGDGDGDDLGGRSESELNQTRLRVAESVKQHAEQNRGRGNLPLGMDRWAEAQMKPAGIPWQTLLARQLRQAVAFRPGAVDYSFSKISRRQGGVGFGVGCPIIPAMVRPVVEVIFVLDTSGSMGKDQLEAGLTEASQVIQAVGGRLTFLSCDYAVHAVGRVDHPSQLSRLVKGGGGSSFIPAFDYIAKMRSRPTVAIFATDGDICVPPTPPKNLNVIWLLIDAYRKDTPTTAYGERIVVSTRGNAEEED